MSKSLELVLAERLRQIREEGYNNDAKFNPSGELAMAAACYALPPDVRLYKGDGKLLNWPWGKEFWKPGERERELVKAAALILAELDRMYGEVPDTEGFVKAAMRLHSGGLGESLTEEEKGRIRDGLPDRAENTSPFNGEKFLEGTRTMISADLYKFLKDGGVE